MDNQNPKRRSSISTRTGDSGETSLLYGERVSKTHPQVEACGAVDELNAALGLAKATDSNARHRAQLEAIQRDLIALMGEIAAPTADLERYEESGFLKIDEVHLQRLEVALADLETQSGRPDGWAVPGATLYSATLDLARATARRAERRVVALHDRQIPVRPLLQKYLNRLSDFLWLLARDAENDAEKADR
jgi:cob(I)alamin adenosyltransferase